jgi:hypothetical protein
VGAAEPSPSCVEETGPIGFDEVVGLAAFSSAVVLVGATAILLSASLRPASFTAYVLTVYLFSIAELVGLAELLSPFHAVTRTGYLIGVAIAAAVAGFVWEARGRPRPPSFPKGRLPELRREPVIWVLGVLVLLGLAYELSVGLTTPPNNWDSLWHHLTRAAGWRQHHAVEYIAGVKGDLGINAYPPNAELQILFGFVLWGHDTFATIPQFLAECALLVSIFGIARRVGFEFVPSVFAALVSATLSIVALQSVTTQNDLCVAAVVAAAIFFALGDRRVDVAIAGVAVGLALGTKTTAILALAIVGLVALAAGRRRRFFGVVSWSAVAFAVFGAYIYVLNIAETGTIFGDPVEQDTLRTHLSAINVVSTALRSLYRFADLSGFQSLVDVRLGAVFVLLLLPTIALTAAAVARSVASPNIASWAFAVALAAFVPLATLVLALVTRALFVPLHLPLNPPGASANPLAFAVNARANEDNSYFGPLGILLVWPLSIGVCIAWARGRIDRRIGALAAALPIYLLVLAATIRWTLYIGRYFIIPVAVAMPLVALVCKNRLLMRAVAVVGVAILVLSHGFSETKPTGLAGTTPIWSLSRADAQALMRPRMRSTLEFVAAEVPKNAHVGVVLARTDWGYPFYGSDLGRTVTYLSRPPSAGEAAGLHLSWLFVHRVQPKGQRSVWQIAHLSSDAATARRPEGRDGA